MTENQLIITLVGALGGLEFLKWLYNRKRLARGDEFKLLREQLEFMQSLAKNKEEFYASQTERLRGVQDEFDAFRHDAAQKELAYIKKIAELELKLAKLEFELAEVRCNDKPCPWRQPPTAYTEPKPKNKTKRQHKEKTYNTDLKDNEDNKTEQ